MTRCCERAVRCTPSESRKALAVVLLLASALLLSVPILASSGDGGPRQQELPRGGSSLADLVWELSQHLPLRPPQSVPENLREPDYEFVIVDGTVVERHVQRSSHEDWRQHTLFPAWAETMVDVTRAAVVNSHREPNPGTWTFVERHGFLADTSGALYEPWWGMGAMRYNKLRAGDRAILVGIRRGGSDVDNPLYNSEFWPQFSVVFNLLVRGADEGDHVCVVAPMGEATDDDFLPDGRVSRVVQRSEYTRRTHCFEVSPNEAFEAVRATIQERF